MKISIVGFKARAVAVKGMDYVSDAVKSTIGPFGLNFMLEKGNRITNDGFTVSRELSGSVENEFERRGALTIHEASSKTNDQVGDATSTSEVLAQAIVKEAIRYLPNEETFTSKMRPSEISLKIKKEKEEIIEKLSADIRMIETEKELVNSARVSVEDDELAALIGKTQFELGKEGIILAEETNNINSSIEKIKGIKIDNGFGTSTIINNQEKQLLEAKDCVTILTNHVLQDLFPVKDLIDALVKNGKRNIMIIARGFSENCIQACLKNIQGGLNIFPINAPYTDQKEIMRDLAAVLGGSYIDSEERKLEDANPDDLGFAVKVIARRYDAIITGGDDGKTQERVKARVEKLQDAMKGSESEFEKRNIQARIGQLTNGFALLKVGAETEVERKRKKDKCDDAVHAVRLAFQGGTVKGGGLAFKEISDALPEDYILKRPLNSIYNQIMISAPADFKIEEWVRDPFLVLKAALTNACSVAATFSSINGITAEQNPKTCSCNKSNE